MNYKELLASIMATVDKCEYGQDRVLLYQKSMKASTPICMACGIKIEIGDKICLSLVQARIHVYRVKWARRAFHCRCLEEKLPSKSLVITSHKLRRSVFILLVLQELGLPGDLAWTIAAGAGWLP